MPDLLEKMKHTIRMHRMLSKGTQKVLLAVSGGPDSMVMADLFWRLAKEVRLFLWVAHLNHMFRGEESHQDAEFVRAWAESRELPCFIAERDVPHLRKPGESKEQAARRVRYQFLAECSLQAEVDRVALAHTLSDQAETVLMRMLSGGGQGLRGMPPVREQYIRPLIGVSREEILGYAQERGVAYRIDSSNLQPEYARNKIRLQLIPYLQNNYNPKVEEALARAAEILRAEDDYLNQETLAWIAVNVAESAECRQFLIENLIKEPLAIQRRVVNRLLTMQGGREVGFGHVEQVLTLVGSAQGTGQLDLPGTRAVKDYRYMRIEQAQTGEMLAQISLPQIQLVIPGETKLPPYSLVIKATVHRGGLAELKRLQSMESGLARMTAFFDFDQVELPLTIRTWVAGDSFQPFGMAGSKKLQDFFVDEKVSPGLRDKIALVANNERIFWIVGMRSSEWGRITDRTRRILRLTATYGGCQDMGGMI